MSPSGALVLGRYEVIRRLGAGGMGEVSLARQTGVPGFERLVILKSLLPSLIDDPALVEVFLDEARVAASLSHPNIVGIYEVGLWQGVYYIVMEHIHGADLAQLIRAVVARKSLVPWPIAANIVAEAALGLDHAHRAVDAHGQPLNIVHRDISPANIMVRHDGVTKVVDFGIATANNRVSHTQFGQIKGKLAYMSPEHIDARALDGRADQFALGVVFWELCAGRRLFKAPNDLDIVRNVLHLPVPPLSSLQRGIPPELDQIAHRMLQRDRNQRFPSCREVALALRTCLSQLRVDAPVAACVRDVLGMHAAGLNAVVHSVATPGGSLVPAPVMFADDVKTTVLPPPPDTLEACEDVDLSDLEDPMRGADVAPAEHPAADPWDIPTSPPEGITLDSPDDILSEPVPDFRRR